MNKANAPIAKTAPMGFAKSDRSKVSRLRINGREAWLKARQRGIGASEIAAACGRSSFKTNVELWREKTGRVAAKDLSENERVEYGTLAEQYLRGLFSVKHRKDMAVAYHRYHVLYRTEYPWALCTLDGELRETVTGKRGILEIKTSECLSAGDWARWENRIPDGYYFQCLWQMLVTGWDFVILFAELRKPDGSSEIREYRIERNETTENEMDFIFHKGEEFWKCVEADKEPPMILTI